MKKVNKSHSLEFGFHFTVRSLDALQLVRLRRWFHAAAAIS
jgi:hypothetical protein